MENARSAQLKTRRQIQEIPAQPANPRSEFNQTDKLLCKKATRLLGKIRQGKNVPPDALPALLTEMDEALSTDIPDPSHRLLALHGEVLAESELFSRAIASFNRAITLSPHIAFYRYKCAAALYQTDEYDRCIEMAQSIPKDNQNWGIQGQALLKAALQKKTRENQEEKDGFLLVKSPSDTPVPTKDPVKKPVYQSLGLFAPIWRWMGYEEAKQENTQSKENSGHLQLRK